MTTDVLANVRTKPIAEVFGEGRATGGFYVRLFETVVANSEKGLATVLPRDERTLTSLRSNIYSYARKAGIRLSVKTTATEIYLAVKP